MYYHETSAPTEIWGNRLAAVAFYEAGTPRRLLYRRSGRQAHELGEDEKPVFVRWSQDGNWALFYEFARGAVYDIVVLDCPGNVAYRQRADDELLRFARQPAFSATALTELLTRKGFAREKPAIDSN